MDDQAVSDTQMKQFISLTDDLLSQYVLTVKPEMNVILFEEAAPEPPQEHPLLAEAKMLVFKLRSFMESADSDDYAFGVETGMQRAAEMLENLIRRHERGDDFGY